MSLPKFIRQQKVKLKYKIGDLVRTKDLKKTFSKSGTSNWSYKSYKITEIVKDTLPSWKIDNFLEIYNEAMLKKTKLTMKENKVLMKALDLNPYRSNLLEDPNGP